MMGAVHQFVESVFDRQGEHGGIAPTKSTAYVSPNQTLGIRSYQELDVTKERIQYFLQQVEHLRKVESNPHSYRLSAGGFLAEIDRMNLEIREYLLLHPGELSY